MKKIWILLLVIVISLSLLACGEEKITTLPDGTAVAGVDLSGMTREDAWVKLESIIGSYFLDLTIDDASVIIGAKDVDMTGSKEAFFVALSAIEAGSSADKTVDLSDIVTISNDKLLELLKPYCSKKMQEASLTFDEGANAYVLTPHVIGAEVDNEALIASVKEAITALNPKLTLKDIVKVLEPTHKADDPEALAALELVNKMTGIQLTYTFQADSQNDSASALQIPSNVLRSFVNLGEDGFSPSVDPELVAAYAQQLAEDHSVAGTSGSFQATNGSTINLTVDYEGLYVDAEALTQEILTCMQEGISEQREAPYLDSGVRDMAYGGTYIEINLTSQHLWFYKNGECIVSTDLVSGMVGAKMNTPTGVYSIYAMDTDTYLVGEDYRSYVNYWMPFRGGYGLHDATWRSAFGGDIYLYDGSHGCVNLPLKAAANIYKNASVGTKVILYGGIQSVPPLDQKFTGSTTYDIADDTDPFQLDIKAKFADPDYTYKSDNTKVVTVSEDGTVTVTGIGTANITVTAKPDSCYAEGTATVTITVHSACDEGRHQLDEPVPVKEATCQPGLARRTCKKCDYTEETEIPPSAEHSFDQWVTVQEATCGQDGIRQRICTGCNIEQQTEVLPASGQHTAGDWHTVVNPTCETDGQQEKSCSVCHQVLETRAVEKTGHNYMDSACTICGKANPDYIVPGENIFVP